MCDRFEEWQEDILSYCKKNGLSYEKAKNTVKASNKNQLVLLYCDSSQDKGMGLLDETPMLVVLWVTCENGQLVFEQTEHTSKYLAQ